MACLSLTSSAWPTGGTPSTASTTTAADCWPPRRVRMYRVAPRTPQKVPRCLTAGPSSFLATARPSSAGGQTAAHLLVHGLDSLQGPHHDAEFDDPAGVVAADDVDAVHVLALHARLELEHRGVPGEDLLRVLEGPSGPTGQRPGRCFEVLRRDGLPALRRVDDRRVEGHVVGQQLIETAGGSPSRYRCQRAIASAITEPPRRPPAVRGRAPARILSLGDGPRLPTAGPSRAQDVL